MILFYEKNDIEIRSLGTVHGARWNVLVVNIKCRQTMNLSHFVSCVYFDTRGTGFDCLRLFLFVQVISIQHADTQITHMDISRNRKNEKKRSAAH